MCVNSHYLKKVGDFVPCGKCPICLKRRANQWVFRLLEEAKVSSSISFHTYTYEIPPYTQNGFQTIVKTDLQKYFKRLRKLTSNKLKYYAVGEYGGRTSRPHYHAIIFNLPHKLLQQPTAIQNAWTGKNTYKEPYIRGHVDIAIGNEATIRYVTNYVMKKTLHVIKGKEWVDTETGEIFAEDRQKEFSLMSKGMGFNWLTPSMRKHIKETLTGVVLINGIPTAIPRYFRDHALTPEERARLAKKFQHYHEDNPKTLEETVNWKYEVHRKHKQLLFKEKHKLL